MFLDLCETLHFTADSNLSDLMYRVEVYFMKAIEIAFVKLVSRIVGVGNIVGAVTKK